MAKVMLVEDDITMQMLLRTLLEIEGFAVDFWRMGTDPVAAIRASQPDLVLTDVNLKGANGFDVLAALRADSELQHLKVIMSSGIDYSDKAAAAGATRFILKPYMPDDLIKLIRQVLAE